MCTSYLAGEDIGPLHIALVSYHHHTQPGNNTSNPNPFTRCQECMMQESGVDSREEECSNDD